MSTTQVFNLANLVAMMPAGQMNIDATYRWISCQIAHLQFEPKSAERHFLGMTESGQQKADYYRRKAAEADRMAREVDSDTERHAFERLAEDWRALAEEVQTQRW